MNKHLKLIITCFILVIATGCNKYITSEVTNDKGEVYYGAYNRRDFTHADVKVFQKGNSKVCDGSVYLNAPSRSITMKNDLVDAKMLLGCSDGTIINLDWQLRKGTFSDGSGEGVDQFNNVYKFKTISKKEYKKVREENKIKFINDKSDSYLKY